MGNMIRKGLQDGHQPPQENWNKRGGGWATASKRRKPRGGLTAAKNPTRRLAPIFGLGGDIYTIDWL